VIEVLRLHVCNSMKDVQHEGYPEGMPLFADRTGLSSGSKGEEQVKFIKGRLLLLRTLLGLSLIVILTAPLPSFEADDLRSMPDDWIVYPNPHIDSSVLGCANYSRREW